MFTVETTWQTIIVHVENRFCFQWKFKDLPTKFHIYIRYGSPIMRIHENDLLKTKSIPWLLGSPLFDSQWKIVWRKLFFCETVTIVKNLCVLLSIRNIYVYIFKLMFTRAKRRQVIVRFLFSNYLPFVQQPLNVSTATFCTW